MPHTVVRMVPVRGGGGGPALRGAPPTADPSCGSCCCCCCCCGPCCSFLDLKYLTTSNGLMKIGEVMLGSLCQSLLIEFGLSEAGTLGAAFHGFLTTAAACVLTTTLLLFCYVISSNTQHLVRQSLFEIVFHATSCFLYLSAASCLAAAVNFYLYPKYAIIRMFSAYPAMTATYYLGGVVGILHGVDAYFALRFYKGYR